jgi:hypothetical protein
MTRETRFIPGKEQIPNNVIESLILYLLLIGLSYQQIKTLRQNQFDVILVVFALMPLVLMGANFSTVQILKQINATENNLINQ